MTKAPEFIQRPENDGLKIVKGIDDETYSLLVEQVDSYIALDAKHISTHWGEKENFAYSGYQGYSSDAMTYQLLELCTDYVVIEVKELRRMECLNQCQVKIYFPANSQE